MSEDCPHCVYEKNEANCRGCFEGSNYRPKPATNADRIRSMTDEELADLFANYECGYCRIHDFCVAQENGRNCETSCLDWLRQEATDG